MGHALAAPGVLSKASVPKFMFRYSHSEVADTYWSIFALEKRLALQALPGLFPEKPEDQRVSMLAP